MSSQARKRCRLRCLLHVTNLVAKAFLLGRKAEDIADELYQAQYHRDFKKMARVWHKFGALGRLHNLIRHIRLSPQRRQEFRQCQSDREGWKDCPGTSLREEGKTTTRHQKNEMTRKIRAKPSPDLLKILPSDSS